MEMRYYPLNFVIVGYPRSGTKYVAEFLTKLGINCGHEQYFTFSHAVFGFTKFNGFIGDSSWLAVPFLQHLHPDTKVIHLVRDPRAAISSHHHWIWEEKAWAYKPYKDFVKRLGIYNGDKHFVDWWYRIRQRGGPIYHLENMNWHQLLRDIAHPVGIPDSTIQLVKATLPAQNTSKSKYPMLKTYSDKVNEIAAELGYVYSEGTSTQETGVTLSLQRDKK